MHNNAFGSNSNAFSLIICKVYTKKENTDSWNSGHEKTTSELPILHISKWAENLWRIVLQYKKILEQITMRGGPPGGRNPPVCARQPKSALVDCAHPSPLPVPIFLYKLFWPKKIRGGFSGWSAAVSRWNLGMSTFALRWSDSAGGTSLPKGEIVVIIITNNSPILGRAISINIFTSTISSQTLVHLLYSILLPEL